MQFTITRHGIPLGEVELGHSESVNTVDFRPLPGYAAVSDVVSEARRAMRGQLFGTGASIAAENAAFEQAMTAWRALNADLELRDGEGRLVPTAALELLDEEEHSPYWRWIATIVFLEAPAHRPAPGPRGSRDGSAEHGQATRCVDCSERDATVVWVQGTRMYSNVPGRADLESEEVRAAAPVVAPASESPRHDPNLCEECAERRYEASRPAGAPSWAEFTHRSNRSASRPAP